MCFFIYVLLKGFINAFFMALSNKNSRHTTLCCICPCQMGLIRAPPPPTTQMSYVIWDGIDIQSIFIDLAKLPQAAGTTCKFSRHSISFNQEDITVRTCSVTPIKVLNRWRGEKHCDAAPYTSQRRFVDTVEVIYHASRNLFISPEPLVTSWVYMLIYIHIPEAGNTGWHLC